MYGSKRHVVYLRISSGRCHGLGLERSMREWAGRLLSPHYAGVIQLKWEREDSKILYIISFQADVVIEIVIEKIYIYFKTSECLQSVL